MKRFMSVILSLVFTASTAVTIIAAETTTVTSTAVSTETTQTATTPIMLSGKIISEEDGKIKVKSYSGDKEVVLTISEDTYIVDAVKGTPVNIKERLDENVIVYYGPAETKSLPAMSNAVAIVCNLPQDFAPPKYSVVEAIEKGTDSIKVTTGGGSMIVTLTNKTPVSNFKNKEAASIDKIEVGTKLMLWYDIVAMSYPGQTAATQAVVLTENNDSMSMSPIMISGKITSEENGNIKVQSYSGDKEVILNLSEDTYIIDAVKGTPVNIKERIDNNVVVYYGPIETKSMPPMSNAVVIICNFPQDFGAPDFLTVEAIQKAADSIKIKTDISSELVTLTNKTPISNFATKEAVTIDKIEVGTKLMVWYDMTEEMNPSQASVTKVLVLDGNITTNEVTQQVKVGALKIADKKLPTELAYVKGTLPEFTGINETAAKKANDMVNKLYKDSTKVDEKSKPTGIMFSYKTINSAKYTSIIINTMTSFGNTSKDTVTTMVLDNTTYEICNFENVLGVNALKLANKFISQQIKSAEEGVYYTDDENAFRGLKSDPMFYVDANRNIVIVFDKYAIAPGSTGAPKFTIIAEGFANVVLPDDQTFIENGIRMVWLTSISKSFGFNVDWNNNTKTATLTKGYDKFTVTLNENMYGKTELETAPILRNEKTYVPISFFEIVVGGCYTVDKSATVTLSALK